MKNLYKKICVVVLSSVVLAGGALVSNSSVSHANSFEDLVKSVLSMGNCYFQSLGKNYKDPIICDFNNPWDLYELIDRNALGSGVYKVGDYFFLIYV